MFWLLGFSVFVYAYVLVAFVSADETLLLFDTFCNNGFWVIPRGWCGFVPRGLWFVAALDSPAEDTFLVAAGYGWCHLYAPVAAYTVELLFVA